MNRLILLLIACALSMGVFQNLKLPILKPMEDNDNYPAFMFRLYSGQTANVQQEPQFWRGKKLACQLSSWWYDLWNPRNGMDMCKAMSSYYAIWFMLTCIILIIWSPRNAMIAMFGTFASLMCAHPTDIIPYFLPWDLLTMFLLTAAFLAYHHKNFVLLIIILLIGGAVKETVLTALLLLWAAPWRRQLKIALMVGIFIIVQVFVRWYCGSAQEWTYAFGMPKFGQLPTVIWLLLANSGALLLLPWILHRLRDWGAAAMLISFVTLQCANDVVNGVYAENRVWLDIAPVLWMLFSETYFKTKTREKKV